MVDGSRQALTVTLDRFMQAREPDVTEQGTLKVAIVGTGAIAHAHAQVLGRDPLASVVAVADPTPAVREKFADEYTVAGRYDSLDALLAAETVDVVHLCTPPGLHKDQAITALRGRRPRGLREAAGPVAGGPGRGARGRPARSVASTRWCSSSAPGRPSGTCRGCWPTARSAARSSASATRSGTASRRTTTRCRGAGSGRRRAAGRCSGWASTSSTCSRSCWASGPRSTPARSAWTATWRPRTRRRR